MLETKAKGEMTHYGQIGQYLVNTRDSATGFYQYVPRALGRRPIAAHGVSLRELVLRMQLHSLMQHSQSKDDPHVHLVTHEMRAQMV